MEYYTDGLRNGWLDAFAGMPQLRVALSSELPGYAQGYGDGYRAQREGRSLDAVMGRARY